MDTESRKRLVETASDYQEEVDRLTRELAHAQAREMVLRHAVRHGCEPACLDCQKAEAMLIHSPASGWPTEVKALVREARLVLVDEWDSDLVDALMLFKEVE